MSDPENEIGRQRTTMMRPIGRPDRATVDRGLQDQLAALEAGRARVRPHLFERSAQPVRVEPRSRATAAEQHATQPRVAGVEPAQRSPASLRHGDVQDAGPVRHVISNLDLSALNRLIMDFGDLDANLQPDLRAVTGPSLIEYGLLATGRNITALADRIEAARAPTLLMCAALVDLMSSYVNMIEQSAALSQHIQGNPLLREMHASLRASLRAVKMFPGLDIAIQKHRNVAAAEEMRAREEREAAEWVGAVTPYPDNPESTIWLGEVRGPLSVFKINRVHGEVYVINRVTWEVGRFTYTDWYNHRGIVSIYHAPWLEACRENVFLQFLYGMVEGFSQGVQSVIETLFKIDEIIGSIRQMLATIREVGPEMAALSTGVTLGAALWQEIMAWGSQYHRSTHAQRARMEGRLIGRLLFELATLRGFGRLLLGQEAMDALAALRTRNVSALMNYIERNARRLAETRAGQVAIELYRDERGAVNFGALFGGSASIRGTAREAGINIYRQLSEAGYTVRGRLRAIVPDIHRYPTVEVRPSGDILGSYRDVMRYLNDARLTGARRVGNTTLEAHHLLEDRLMTSFGISQRQGLCIALEASDHAIFSGELPRYLPRGRLFFDIDEIFHAHSLMYQKAGRPEWIQDIRAFLRQHRDQIRRIYQQGRIPGRRGSDFPQRLERVQHFLDSL